MIKINQLYLMTILSFFVASYALSAETDFSVITFNVQMRPILDTFLSKDLEKKQLISERLNAYDIVGVQESFSKQDLLMSKLQHPYMVHLSQKRPAFLTNTFLTNAGLAIFSKYPILEKKHEFYKDIAYCCAGDILASKGILMTRIDINGAIVDVYNTHMHAGNTIKENDARVKQVAQLVNYINSNSPPSNAVILMGDFNMSPKRQVSTRKELKPNYHYSDDADMFRRTSAFQTMINSLNLTDAIDNIKQDPAVTAECRRKYLERTKKSLLTEDKCQQEPDEIDRIFYRPGKYNLELLEIRKDSHHFLNQNGVELSDGNPNIAVFRISNK